MSGPAKVFLEHWIDALVAVFAIQVNSFTTVDSKKIMQGTDYPDKITPSEKTPIALTTFEGLDPIYTASGSTLQWTGHTELHVAANADARSLPNLPKWFGLILTAVAGSITLGGKVADFRVTSIKKTVFQYNDEAPHWGFVVEWTVTEQVALNVQA